MGRGAAVLLSLVASLSLAAPAERIELSITGPEPETLQLQASVQELLSRLSLKTGGDGPLLARVSVRLGEVDCLVAVLDGRGEVATSRTLQRRENWQLTVEAIAYIVQSTVEALADLERNPLQRPTPDSAPPMIAAPADKPVAPPEPVQPVSLEFGALLTGRAFSSDQLFVFGGGLSTSLRVAPASHWAPRVSLLVTYNVPFDGASEEALRLSVQTLTVRALAGVRVLGNEDWGLELQGGGGTDVLFASGFPTTGASLVRYSANRTDASVILTAQASVHHRLTSSADVFLALSGDLDLQPHGYYLQTQTGKEQLFDAWRVRPSLALGFTFELYHRGAR